MSHSNLGGLQTQLLNSRIQVTNNPLYQTINQLILNAIEHDRAISESQETVRTDLATVLTYGTSTERGNFSPNPPPLTLLLFWETDNLALYVWAGTWTLVTGTGITQLTGDVTAGPGSGTQAATIPARTFHQSTYSNPTGAGTTELMMGFNATIAPANLTRLFVSLAGYQTNSGATINDGVNCRLRYGTGTPPANGDAVSGTIIGNRSRSIMVRNTADPFNFEIHGIISGLSIGTSYWLDASVNAITGGTGQIWNLSLSAFEI